MMTAGDAALSYDQRSVRAGPPVGPARPVRSGNIVVTLNFASIIVMGKQEGIRWPSPRGAGPAKRSCTPASACHPPFSRVSAPAAAAAARAGPPVGPARPVRSGNIVVTLNFASMNFYG